MQAIDAYLKAPPPGYALLIEGPWGAGKTHFWRRKSERLEGLAAITFSAAGLSSYADLERALFQASIEGVGPKAAIEASTVLGRAFLRFVHVDPDDIKLKAGAASGKSVICIDDLERFAGNFSILFGFIVNLLDDNRVHCILIADENRAVAMEGYGVSKERIVGKTVRIAPSMSSFCDEIIKGFANEQSRNVLQGGKDRILEIVTSSGVRNLRTVRFFLGELEEVVRNISHDEASSVMKSALPGALAFCVFAVSREIENARFVARAFAQGDLGMALAMQDHAKEEGGGETDFGRLAKLLAELRLDAEAYGWPQSPSLIAMVEGGDFSYSQLAEDFELRSAPAVIGAPDAVAVLKDYSKHSDEEVRAAIREAKIAMFEVPSHLARVFDIFEMLYFFSKRGVFEPTPDAWTDEVISFVRGLEAEPKSIASSEFEPWVSSIDNNKERVLNACNAAVDAHRRLVAEKQRDDALEALITGQGCIPDATAMSVFTATTDIATLLHSIRDVGMPAVVRFRRYFSSRLRIQNAADFVGNDRDKSLELADRITADVREVRPMKLADAELLAFAETLREFAVSVDRYRMRNNPQPV